MFRVFLIILTSSLIGGCGGWFGDQPAKPLSGKRISVMSLVQSLKPDPKLANVVVRLPRPNSIRIGRIIVNYSWPDIYLF